MEDEPRICVIVPVFNHGLTVQRVVRGAKAVLPVIAVDDGSNDQTPKVLATESGITLLTLPRNQGKAAALKAGFAKAEELGFTHAITIDADGQHPVEALGDFAAACRKQPNAFIIGVRDLKAARAPIARRISNGLSTFWFRFETGVKLTDTQCGYRVYPLAAIRGLKVDSDRYAFELEIMVKAAWAGIPLVPQPVPVDYEAPTSQLSHFDPLRDFLRISRVHSRLAGKAVWMSVQFRNGSSRRKEAHS
jgi:glycosyltransferase involved in cell wall biosynthesis